MMGTRCGTVDPGILTYLLRTQQVASSELDGLLNEQSVLVGISGVSSDMREVLSAMSAGNARAKLAFEIFIHRLCSEIGAMTASLRGLDVLIFTAGIGENSPEVRSRTCEKLAFLGVRLDPTANAQRSHDKDIATPDSGVRVLVIRAQEDWAIAQECAQLSKTPAPRQQP